MPVRPYSANSFGAVQGGVMALLAEVAGGQALGAARGDPVVVTDLQVAYLALGRVGPIVSRARVLPAGPDGLPRSAVVELVDAGLEDGGRLATLVTVGTSPAVSYTHLDVYKRQLRDDRGRPRGVEMTDHAATPLRITLPVA